MQVEWGVGSPLVNRDIFHEVLQAIQQYPTFTYVTDIRKQGVVSPISQQWWETELLPVAIQAGLKKVAVIVDEEQYERYHEEAVQRPDRAKFPQYLEFRYLCSPEEAQQWATEVCDYYEGRVSAMA